MKVKNLEKSRYSKTCFKIYLEIILIDDNSYNLRKAWISNLIFLKVI